MEICSVKEINLFDFFKEHENDIIIFGYGGADQTTREGYYHMALLYNGVCKLLEGTAKGTANQCILKGFIIAADRINRPMNVHLLTMSVLGFKKATSAKGVNQELCNELINCIEHDKKCTLTIHELYNKGTEIKKIIKNAGMYFKTI